MNDEFIKNVLRKGKKGEEWLHQLPKVIKEYEKKWLIQVLPPFNLSYNYVAPAVQKDGMKAVLRIGLPWEKDEFTNEVNALKIFQGEGVPKLLKKDDDKEAILIELIEPGVPLSTIYDDDKATKILANLMKKIWKPVPKNHSFITIYDWTRELRKYPKSGNKTLPMDMIRLGIDLFTELISSSKETMLTHADIHHDNVLSSQKNNWVAIDPKGIIAEPLYDTAALIRNPYKKLKIMNNNELDALQKRRIQILSEELCADPKRIYKWYLAQTILSCVWTAEIKEYTDFSFKIINSLQRIKTQLNSPL